MPARGSRKPKPLIGDPNDPQGMAALLARFLEWLGVSNYAATTIEDRRQQVGNFAAWCAERDVKRPNEVTKATIERYQRWLYHRRQANGRPLSFDTQQHQLVAVRGFFRWLSKHNHVEHNPTADLELPKLERHLPKHVLSVAEVEQVLSAIDVDDPLGLRDRAILETFYSTAIRRAELAALKLLDLDVGRGTVTVRRGKGKKDRVVPIGARAVAWVEKYLEVVRPKLVLHATDDDGSLFLSREGLGFTPHTLSKMAKGWIDAAGLGKKGACHIFRHSAATLMLEGGADIRFIQQLLGHARLDTTQVYTQVSIQKLKEVHTATHPAKLARPEAELKNVENVVGPSQHNLQVSDRTR